MDFLFVIGFVTNLPYSLVSKLYCVSFTLGRWNLALV